ncbi:MAG: bifunctional phosphoglucose/phosphomannose isomerase [Bacteroidota bacterium]
MSDMKQLVQRFPEQLKEALAIGNRYQPQPSNHQIQSVLITGLGGSGIGGTIVGEIVSGECPVPVTVNKDYFLPAFVNSNSLVIVCSYSGNTEETLYAMEEAIRRNAKIVCITSGGKVEELAKQHNFDLILIPSGMPPRSCLGYSLTQLFFILNKQKLINDDFIGQLESAIGLITKEEAAIKEEAHVITDFLFRKTPVIYAVDGYNGVATRVRQQINENSKVLCWHHIIPEMNHNELVGWAGGSDQIAVLLLRNKSDFSRSQARIEINKKVFSKYTPHIYELWSKGNSRLEQSIYLINVTDWVSCYLADKKSVDASEINVINELKGALSKI